MANEDRPYDAGDPKDVKAAIKSAQRWEDKKARVLGALMATEDGRRFVRELLEATHVGTNPFNPDLARMSFNCGELNVGQRVMADVMNATPKEYMLMMAEANPAPEQKDDSNG